MFLILISFYYGRFFKVCQGGDLRKNAREGDFTEAEAEILITQADVVGITGTTFTSYTIEHLLKLRSTKA